MAQPRNWQRLAASTRQKYLSRGRTLGMTPAQVEQYYLTGGDMRVFRGHRPHPGASERQWSAMLWAARAARLNEDVEGDWRIVLENLLAKGFTPTWIIERLEEKRDSRDTYRSVLARQQRKRNDPAGWAPGRPRYFKRTSPADIEIYYYH